MRFWLCLTLAVFMGGSVAANAQVPPTTQRVLVPVLWHGAGYGGSLWMSELYMSNSGTQPVIVAPGSPECPFELCDKTLAPGALARYEGTGSGSIPGAYFVVEEARAGDIHFLLRAWDVSRQAENFGTTIPVVREDEWLTGTTELLHVPVDELFRVTLRAYEYQPSDTLSLNVTILPEDGDDALAQLTLDLRGGDTHSTYPLVPSFATITNLVEQFPQLAGAGYVRIRLEPSTPRQYWAFASVTNNLTHSVAVLTPE
ncbi:MAG: hypothetical protein NDJ92_00325 [Thermoanaerobaculia bacterium]|nr:hypothetical protein [Thermoanaerobaculia bacterium]